MSGKIQPIENSIGYFIPSTYQDDKGETRNEYLLTRDGFSLLVMGFTGQKALEWKLKYIDAFNQMETALREVDPRANILLRIYSGGQDAVVASKELAEIESQPYKEKIALDAPLVEFAETVSKSADNILMRNMAKLMCQQHINIGEKRLYKLLRQHDVLMSDNEPYQSYIDRGYFQVKEGSYTTPYGTTILNNTTLVTPKGQIWLVGKVREWLETA